MEEVQNINAPLLNMACTTKLYQANAIVNSGLLFYTLGS